MEQDITATARDDLEGLPREASSRLLTKFEKAAEWPEHYLDGLTGNPYYKLRAGDYRAIIDWDKTDDVQTMILADHRKNVYGRL